MELETFKLESPKLDSIAVVGEFLLYLESENDLGNFSLKLESVTDSGESPKIHLNTTLLPSCGHILANPIWVPTNSIMIFPTMWVLSGGKNLTGR